jgi:diaminohydroxyphosphoribosylaminopyrimidine deaminase/5-amino-6-(5-phosphoribosylamino)uracil reductase
VLIVARQSAIEANARHAERIRKRGIEILACPDEGAGSNLPVLLDALGRRDVQQVLVEGGPRVLTSFLKEGLADEVCVYVAPSILGREGTADIGAPMTDVLGRIELDHVGLKTFDADVRISGRIRNGGESPLTPENRGSESNP